MTEAKITIEELGSNLKIAHIAGQLDESNVDEKIQEIYQIIEKVPRNLSLILNLENLDYMNSKSIGYITDIYGKITETGGKMAISGAKSNIIDILQVVGLTQLIKTFPSLEQAKESFGGAEIATAPTPEMNMPTEPTPAEPTPAEPTPEVAAPTAPTPEMNMPTEPTPAEPTPAEPTPAEPAPEVAAPAAPTPEMNMRTEPTPAEPAPAEPTAPTAPTPEMSMPVEPAPAEPTAPLNNEEGTYKFEQ